MMTIASRAGFVSVLISAALVAACGVDEPDTVEVSQGVLVPDGDWLWVTPTGGCLDVPWYWPDDGVPLQAYPQCSGWEGQTFHVVHVSEYIVELRVFDKCMDVPSSTFVDGARLQVWTCNGTDAQRFRILSSNGGFQLRTLVNDKCVDATWGPIELWGCSDASTQRWQVARPQTAEQAPPGPNAWFDIVHVRDHRYDPPREYDQPVVAAEDRALFEQGFRFEWRTSGSASWSLFGTDNMKIGVGRTTSAAYTHPSNAKRDYRVVAYNAYGEASSGYLTLDTTPPAAPSMVRFTEIFSNGAYVEWNDNSNNETGFRVRRDGVLYSDRPANNTRMFVAMSPGEHCVSVAARNGYGESSAPSACVMIGSPTPYIDLIATDPVITPLFPSPGQSFTLSWSECNVGTQAAGGYAYQVRLDGAVVSSGTRSGLAASTCATRSYPRSGLSAGSHLFEMLIDTNGQIGELRENNNYTSYGMVVN